MKPPQRYSIRLEDSEVPFGRYVQEEHYGELLQQSQDGTSLALNRIGVLTDERDLLLAIYQHMCDHHDFYITSDDPKLVSLCDAYDAWKQNNDED